MAVLIVAYRSADKLENCIRSVQRHLPGLDVHVWDNSGTADGAVRRLAARIPEAHWYLGGENIGFAAAVNRLITAVPDRDVLLLNPDAELIGSLTSTRAAIDDPATAAAAPMTDEARGDDAVTSRARRHQPWDVAHRRRTVLNALGEVAIAAEVLRGTWLSNLYRSQPRDVDGYLTGACLAIRREAWESLGPFNEEFFLYGEEADWQSRAIAAGWRLRLADERDVRHSAQGTVVGDPKAATRSTDLVWASIALEVEHRYGPFIADCCVAAGYAIEAGKRILGRHGLESPNSDVVVVVDGPQSESVHELISQAKALARQGRAVTVVSLRALGSLPRELSPSIRLLRRPWWWPRTWPGDASTVVVTGTSKRERAFARLFSFGRRTRHLDTSKTVGRASDTSTTVKFPNYDLEHI